jgi:hypothetical protein
MLAPTFGYFNFYDIGIVAFFTAMLYFLFTRRHAAYLGVFALATFNHENNLLMAPVAALIARGNLRGWRYWAFVAAQPALYVLARVALNWWFPTTRLWDPRTWRNLMYLTTPTLHLLLSAGTFIFWYACALLGYRYAGRDLKIAVLLFPQLVAVTFLFGKFSETRQFDAFIPVAVALILRFVDVRTEASRRQASGGATG